MIQDKVPSVSAANPTAVARTQSHLAGMAQSAARYSAQQNEILHERWVAGSQRLAEVEIHDAALAMQLEEVLATNRRLRQRIASLNKAESKRSTVRLRKLAGRVRRRLS